MEAKTNEEKLRRRRDGNLRRNGRNQKRNLRRNKTIIKIFYLIYYNGY